MISIIDYGLGNLKSMAGALEKIGVDYTCTRDHSLLKQANGFILPGVGAFPDGIRNILNFGIFDVIKQRVIEDNIPILGICLGFQLLGSIGTEFEEIHGLDWISGKVIKLESQNGEFRIPHVGWNEISRKKESLLFKNIQASSLFYFTHSFHLIPTSSEDIIATCNHGQEFVAVVQRERIFGTQFHPEKSQKDGLELLKNYCEFTSQC